MMTIKTRILIVILLLTTMVVLSNNISTTQDGDWNNDVTWGNNTYPGCYDTIFVNHNVLLDYQEKFNGCGPIVLVINSDLTFDGGKMKLPFGSELYLNDGAHIISEHNGNTDLVSIGGDPIWNGKDSTITGPDYSNGGTHLPIKFKMMSYSKNGELLWVTTSEQNNDFFTIKVLDESYILIDKYTKLGSGNTTTDSFYSLKLIGLENNIIELWQTDYDGTNEYVSRLHVRNREKLGDIILVPNPAKDETFFVMGNDSNDVITVYDMSGKRINVIVENNRIQGLTAGIYIVAVGEHYKGILIMK